MKSKTYEEFVEKFKLKKTTDDCYTPPQIYDAIKRYACDRYQIDESKIIRPFYPGDDYENEEYPEDCFVLDNPPFSILSRICDFYVQKGIRFFLFAPTLTAFGSERNFEDICHIVTGAQIVYENGARVNTSFITNCELGIVARTDPALTEQIHSVQIDTKKSIAPPKYDYPSNLLTAATMGKLSKKGVDLTIKKGECVRVKRLDAQVADKKTVYGGGLLISDKLAESRVWQEEREIKEVKKICYGLSEREKELIAGLN